MVVGLSACAEKEVILEGERFDPRAPLDASIAVEGQPQPVDTTGQIENRSAPISLPAMTSNAEWTHRAANARHLPPHAALSASPVRIWSVSLGTSNSRQSRVTAAPVVSGGRIYAMDAVARLNAVSSSGAVLWSVDLRPPGDASDLSGGGLAVIGGRVFATTGYGELLAVDAASGAIAWRQRLGSPVMGAPTVEGGIVYVVGRDSSAWAVRTENGRVLWTLPGTPSPTGMIGAAGPAVSESKVFFPFSSGEVSAALKSGGVRQWSSTVAGQRLGRAYAGISDITGDPVVAGSTVFVGNQSGRTVSIDAETGDRNWTAKNGALAPVLPVGNSLFLVNDEARLMRLDAATGEPIWSIEMPFFVPTRRVQKRVAITAHFGPILAGGRLVVASGDGVLRFFSPVDGRLLGTVEIPGGAASLPAVAAGTLYVTGQNGQLHAFR